MKYIKDHARLTVKYIDADTEETLFEIPNRTWNNVGELLSDYHVTELMNQNIDGVVPDNLLVIVVGEFSLTE